ncbi:MAG: hypothetical protein K2Y09_11750 [Nitrosomonas sp.]|uniref:hypothetical protein n=1 Tax=Nitrosomonas sp. TaxID=42353 RepID=UPI001D3183BC|nr:hypothetical protein [Nitrosomonas sp.]MBX9895827.1 hypothetical protein [Nitrosomonas sp.]
MEYYHAIVQYQFNKLKHIREGIYPEYGGNIEVELYTFFILCYHLKDWIINEDPECKSFTQVNKFIKESSALKICDQICQTIKHRKLTAKQWEDSIPINFKLSTVMTIGPPGMMAEACLKNAQITTERGEECCFSLAEECMNEWNQYFLENGINNL